MATAVYRLQTGQDSSGNPMYQESNVDNPDINQDLLAKLQQQGYQFQGYRGAGPDIQQGNNPYRGGASFNSPGSNQQNQQNQGGGQMPDWMNKNSPNYDPTQDPIYQSNLKMINDMKAQFDASSLHMMDIIHQNYGQLIDQQKQANVGAEAARNQSLLMGGSSRYAQLSSEGIQHEQISYGLRQISGLQTQENQALAQAQQAMDSGDFQFMEKALGMAETARQDKQTAMQKQADMLQQQLASQQEAQRQQSNETAIGSFMTQGITDPAEILQEMNKSGYQISSKELNDTMANLNPNAKAVADVMTNAAKNGASKDVLASIGKARTVADALNAAGSTNIDPTSKLGIYKAYADGMTKKGYQPDDYQSWATAQDDKASEKTFQNEMRLYNAKSAVDLAAKKAQGIIDGTVAPDGTPIKAPVYTGVKSIDDEINKQNAGDFQTTLNAYQTMASVTQRLFGKTPDQLTIDDLATRDKAGNLVLNPKIDSEDLSYLSTSLGRIKQPDIARMGGNPTVSFFGPGIGGLLQKGETYIKGQQMAIPSELLNALKTGNETYQQKVKLMNGSLTTSTNQQVEDHVSNTLKTFATAHPDQVSQMTQDIKSMEQALGRPVNPSEFIQRFPKYAQ